MPTLGSRLLLFPVVFALGCAENTPPSPASNPPLGNPPRGSAGGSGGARTMPGSGGTGPTMVDASSDTPSAMLDAELYLADAGTADRPDGTELIDAPGDLLVDRPTTETAPDGPALPSVAETPPRGARALDAWLAAGHYKRWKCEATVMNPRPLGVHGRNRVCCNDLASRHGTGAYPVGAAAVKEIYFGDRVGIHAVALKIAEGAAASSWYWYEKNDQEGVGVPGCASCHSRAERQGGKDYIFIQVK